MKLSELRLSNLFYPIVNKDGLNMVNDTIAFKVCTIGFTVEAIHFDKTPAQVETWTKFKPFEIEPIRLTSEWLTRLGFVNGQKGGFFFNRKMDLSIIGHEDDYNGLYIGRIEYVHTLQNLFFAITGDDLITVGKRLN